MSANAAVATRIAQTRDRERGHRTRLAAGYILAIVAILTLSIYGFDYYTLSVADRPFSPKHVLLKPSGVIGIKLGLVGFAMFLLIFLYPLRKRWAWLGRQGSSKHWLDFHVLLGLAAPFVIALHSSFKFSGFAGIAFWIMAAVSASGIVGRYLYAQIPRSLNAAVLSCKETQELQERLSRQLAEQDLLPADNLREVLRLPRPETVQRMPIVLAIAYMMLLDVLRVFHMAKLRRKALAGSEYISTLGGMLRTRHVRLERAIDAAGEEAKLAKKILFLSRSEKVFHLWHVVHRPFSYTFAVLALIHIGVVMMMGYL